MIDTRYAVTGSAAHCACGRAEDPITADEAGFRFRHAAGTVRTVYVV